MRVETPVAGLYGAWGWAGLLRWPLPARWRRLVVTTEFDEKPWAEVEVPVPAYPEDANLIPLRASVRSRMPSSSSTPLRCRSAKTVSCAMSRWWSTDRGRAQCQLRGDALCDRRAPTLRIWPCRQDVVEGAQRAAVVEDSRREFQ